MRRIISEIRRNAENRRREAIARFSRTSGLNLALMQKMRSDVRRTRSALLVLARRRQPDCTDIDPSICKNSAGAAQDPWRTSMGSNGVRGIQSVWNPQWKDVANFEFGEIDRGCGGPR